ncbi:hypothetical protein B0H19DRAFT_1115313 [Mycena capillaripes]|nr:hypothetical protein B0H19DRAFT_1115313 [Mycena capillaripes]
MWLMDTGDWAGKVLFSITQWCGVSWNELLYTKMNTTANRILVGRTFEALHDACFGHGDIGGFDSFRHAIIDVDAPGLSQEDLLNGRAPCYIVGFSEAEAEHQCMRKAPVVPLGSYLSAKQVGCKEIADVLLLLRFLKKVPTRVSAAEALEWHAKYSERNPDQPNIVVLIAQRAKLFAHVPSVYPQLDVLFEGEGEYPKAVLRNATDSDEETELAPDHVAPTR